MNKKILFVLVSLLFASCVRAADAEDAETKRLTIASFKDSLRRIVPCGVGCLSSLDSEKKIIARWNAVNALKNINQEEYEQLVLEFRKLAKSVYIERQGLVELGSGKKCSIL